MAFQYDMISSWIPRNARSIIDIGCGRGLQGFYLRCDEFSTDRKIGRMVGIDVKPTVLDFCKRFGIYDELVQWDLTKCPLPFSEGEFDVAIMSDVAEHQLPNQASDLIREAERISDLTILTLSTVPEDIRARRRANKHGPYDIHQSHFGERTLRKMGYEVRGLQRSRSFAQGKLGFLLENPFWMLPMLSARIICRKGSISNKPGEVQRPIPLSISTRTRRAR